MTSIAEGAREYMEAKGLDPDTELAPQDYDLVPQEALPDHSPQSLATSMQTRIELVRSSPPELLIIPELTERQKLLTDRIADFDMARFFAMGLQFVATDVNQNPLKYPARVNYGKRVEETYDAHVQAGICYALVGHKLAIKLRDIGENPPILQCDIRLLKRAETAREGLKTLQNQLDDRKATVHPVVQKLAYFADPDNPYQMFSTLYELIGWDDRKTTFKSEHSSPEVALGIERERREWILTDYVLDYFLDDSGQTIDQRFLTHEDVLWIRGIRERLVRIGQMPKNVQRNLVSLEHAPFAQSIMDELIAA